MGTVALIIAILMLILCALSCVHCSFILCAFCVQCNNTDANSVCMLAGRRTAACQARRQEKQKGQEKVNADKAGRLQTCVDYIIWLRQTADRQSAGGAVLIPLRQ